MPERDDAPLTLHYAPRTRSFTALWLLEELGVDYRLESFSLATGHQRSPAFLALNPLGKVPVVVRDGVAWSELGAIAIGLADLHTSAALAPAPDAPERAAYLRWIFFSSAIMEPALGERFFQWKVPSGSVAWGSFDRMLAALHAGLETGPFLLGARFTAADVLVGATSRFGLLFGAFDREGPVASYVARLTERPAFVRAQAVEAREGERFPPPPKA